MNAKTFTIGVLAALFSVQLAAAPASLDDVLREAQAERAQQAKLMEERRAAYNSASAAEQEKMLQQALAERERLSASAKAMADKYSANEIRINELVGQLQRRAGELGVQELFGIARQMASDQASALQQSLITAQFAGSDAFTRDETLRKFASSKRVPSPEELETLWLILQQELTESGKVARFKTAVVQPDGKSVASTVTRVGPFTAISDKGFLSYLPPLKSLHMLPRQPPDRMLDLAHGLHAASGNAYVPAVVDASRGVLLNMYVERPTFVERIHQGELVGYVIIAVGIVGAIAFVFQLFYLLYVRFTVSWQLRNLDTPKRNNPLGRVMLAFRGDPNKIEEDADIAELRISEAVLHEIPRLERFQALLRLVVAAGPLLGLIGTVVGMIITFQAITEAGSSDPRLMARGIGQAMIATVLGLGVAIPMLFANAGLNSLSRTVVQILDEQSAGLLAESLEKRRRG
jgi:biopolymer transport protein ExbB